MLRSHAVLLAGLLAFVAAAPSPAVVHAADENTCVFLVSMVSGTDVNNLDFTVNYVGTAAQVDGTTSNPDCVGALGGQAFAGFSDDDSGHLKASIIRLSYFSGPVVIAGCRISHDSLVPTPGDFSVTLTNAGRDGEDSNVEPLPVVEVTDVECPGELPIPPTTTTTTTTTTTLPPTNRCGFPATSGNKPTASDALKTLRTAVGLAQCLLCVCDVNSSGTVSTSDALGVLRAAVGSGVVLNCPAC